MHPTRGHAQDEQVDDTPAGILTKLESTDKKITTIQAQNGEKTFQVAEGDSLEEGDEIKTPASTTAAITLADDSQITVGPNSKFKIESVLSQHSAATALKMTNGFIHFLIKKIYTDEKPFTVETKSTAMGVRGTEFTIEEDETTGTADLHTLEGSVAFAKSKVELKNTNAFEIITAGKSSRFQRGMARPEKPKHFDRAKFNERLAQKHPVLKHQIERVRDRHSFQEMRKQFKEHGGGMHKGATGPHGKDKHRMDGPQDKQSPRMHEQRQQRMNDKHPHGNQSQQPKHQPGMQPPGKQRPGMQAPGMHHPKKQPH